MEPLNRETKSRESAHPSTGDGAQAVSLGAATGKAWDTPGPWTTRRLILLGERGPATLDIAVRIGSQSLSQASHDAVAQASEEILGGLEPPVTWEQLFEQPLVRSGWLGNLVPEPTQRETLLAMVDTRRDGLVQAAELRVFLTRGLSRSAPFQIADLGSEPTTDANDSLWGAADENRDLVLDTDERLQMPVTVRQRDHNLDSIVTAQEAQGELGRDALRDGTVRRNTMLQTTSILLLDVSHEADTSSVEMRPAAAENAARQPLATAELPPQALARASRRLAAQLLAHYTFLNEIPREQWADWTDAQWSVMDENGNQSLDRRELEQFATADAGATLYVCFPDLEEAEAECEVHAQLTADGSAQWTATRGGGLWLQDGYRLQVTSRDGFSPRTKSRLRQELEQALRDPQQQAFVISRLQLQADALDLLREDARPQQLSDERFRQVWRWLAVRQGQRVAARWTLASAAWFHLGDSDGDGRLTELEIRALPQRLVALDHNGDGRLTPREIPMVATLELSRSDPRLDDGRPLQSPAESGRTDGDWWGAMDTNSDGYVTYREFLGSREDFAALDLDKDGFVSRAEVYGGDGNK